MNLLFDLDGTLTDSFSGITRSIQHGLRSLGLAAPPAESLRWCIGPPFQESLPILLGATNAHLAGAVLAKYRERYGSVGLFENEAYPGIENALAELNQRGHRLFVATSKWAVFARRIVSHFGLAKYFCSVDGSESDGTRKNKAELIAHILKREAIAPGEAIMIGDRKHDILGARHNGVAALGVLWGYGSREELEMAGARACLASPKELAEAISGVQNQAN
jgi:phosphoglycolate phosphatase